MKEKLEPYCTCGACVCISCKKPFAVWVKGKPKTFKQIMRFGSGKCKECYDKK